MGENSRAYARAAPVSPRNAHGMTLRALRQPSSTRPATAFGSSAGRPVRLADAQSCAGLRDPMGVPTIADMPPVYLPITSATVTSVSVNTRSVRAHRPRTALSASPHRPQAPHVVSMLANHPLSARRRVRCARAAASAARRPGSARRNGSSSARGISARADSSGVDELEGKPPPLARLAAHEALDHIAALLRKA